MTFLASDEGRKFLRIALVVGLLVRLAVLWHTGTLGTPIVDEQHFARLGRNIAEGNGFAWGPGQPTSVRPPLYPVLIAAVYTVAGIDNQQAVRVAHIMVALMTSGTVFLLGRRMFNAAVGRYAAGLVWLYPSLIFFNFMILSETLFTALLAAFVLLSLRLLDKQTAGAAVLCGLSLGLGALTRSVLWPLPIALCPLLLLVLDGSWSRRLALSALVFVGFVSVVGPWTVRNTRLQQAFTIIDTMDFRHLQMGNHEFTPNDRMWAGSKPSPVKRPNEEIARAYPDRKLTEGLKDQWAWRGALQYIVAHPLITLRRSFIRFADFWGIEREFVAGVQWQLFAPPTWFVVAGSLSIAIVYSIVALLAAAGIWLTSPGRRVQALVLLPILAIVGAHSLAFGHSRYHIPLMPILAIYATAVVALREQIEWSRYRPAVFGAAVATMALLGIWLRQIFIVDAARIRTFLDRMS
jgi:4-amino-4-deoxy-L-arabinose transferase-like glycosyltransferase